MIIKYDKKYLDDIKNSLLDGKLVIFPTETVYGLGANALDKDAVDSIFIAKGRANDNPLIVHLASKENIEKYAIISNDIERKLIDTFMPGPFTIILKKKDIIPNNVSAGLDTVGIRIPRNEIAHEILKYTGIPIAAPSANVSGKPSGTQIKDIEMEFKDKVEYIIDGSESEIGLESTVVKVIDGVPTILRPGYVTKEDIISLLGECKLSDNLFKNNVTGPIESPGMKYRHYAPLSKVLMIYSCNKNNLIDLVKKNVIDKTIIIGSDTLKDMKCYKFINYGSSLEEISHNIFHLLRIADLYNPNLIIIEGVKKEGLGLAIMNRLIRACSYNYIEKD